MELSREELLQYKIKDGSEIQGLLIDYKKLLVDSVIIKKHGLFKKAQPVPWNNIRILEKGELQLAGTSTGDSNKDPERFGELYNANVVTERGRKLGRIVTFKIDSSNAHIMTLWVKTPLPMRGLWRQTLIVSRNQIMKASVGTVVVEDSIVASAMAPATTSQFVPTDPDPEPVASSNSQF